MSSKQFRLDGSRLVTVTKRHSSRHLRLTLTPSGDVKVSIPAWAPYKAGLDFARSRQQWIIARHTPAGLLMPNQPVGKAHHLQFVAAPIRIPRTRIAGSLVTVHHPAGMSWQDRSVQKYAETASIRALRRQAEALLPDRLADLAARHGFEYSRVNVKQLKSRWGSCDAQKNIVLNLFLMQLPWDCIDYVLLHELTHTQVLHHGPDFWQAMENVLPQAKQMRKKLRDHQPVVQAGMHVT